MELWWEKQNLLWSCYNSRKKDMCAGMKIDGSFLPQQKGEISSTFTIDWYLRKGGNRHKLGEWLNKTIVLCDCRFDTHPFHQLRKGLRILSFYDAL
jgi:hypothetical protein